MRSSCQVSLWQKKRKNGSSIGRSRNCGTILSSGFLEFHREIKINFKENRWRFKAWKIVANFAIKPLKNIFF